MIIIYNLTFIFTVTQMITKNTSVLIEGLHACESYMFIVGLRGGPFAMKEIITRENAKYVLFLIFYRSK